MSTGARVKSSFSLPPPLLSPTVSLSLSPPSPPPLSLSFPQVCLFFVFFTHLMFWVFLAGKFLFLFLWVPFVLAVELSY
jgi:hypothetical protein